MGKIKVAFKKLDERAKMPMYAHPEEPRGNSGADLFCIDGVSVMPMSAVLIGTGLQVAIPEGFEIQIRPKSGLALEHWITVLNTPGTIDASYRGEIKVLIFNLHPSKTHVFKAGDKIAQAVLAPVAHAEYIESASDLSITVRGDGGFGSTL